MSYTREIAVEFNHCDPAGIVFYPRYFEMTNAVVENFFREVVNYPFARMVAEGRGIPTVRIEIDFRAPSRLGDTVAFRLDTIRIGNSSMTFHISGACRGEVRLDGRFTLVWRDPRGVPERIPEAVRAVLQDQFCDEATG